MTNIEDICRVNSSEQNGHQRRSSFPDVSPSKSVIQTTPPSRRRLSTAGCNVNSETNSPELQQSKSFTSPTHAKPPPHAFSSLPLTPGAMLSNSPAPVGMTGSSRMYEQSKNLGYIPSPQREPRPVVEKNGPANPITGTVDLSLESEDDISCTVVGNASVSLPEYQKNEVKTSDRTDLQMLRTHAMTEQRKGGGGDVIITSLVNNPENSMGKEVELKSQTKPDLQNEQGQEQENGAQPPLTTEPIADVTLNHSREESMNSDGGLSISSIPLKPRSVEYSDLSNEESVNSHKDVRKLNLITTHGGSSSPSVLSSKGGSCDPKDSEEVKRREETRLNHLSLLLNLHRQNEKMKNSGLVEKKKKKNFGEISINKAKRKKKNRRKSGEGGYKTDSSRASSKVTSNSIAGSMHRNHNPSSIFDNFEKNWISLHPTTAHRERMCFASAALVLLDNEKGGSYSPIQSAKRDMGNGKTVPSEKLTSNMTDASLQVVKLLWKKVVLPAIGLPLDDVDLIIENVVETLFEKLRYLVLTPASSKSLRADDSSKNPHTAVHLSHEVYGEYAKYIINSDDRARQYLEEWRSSFSTILENILVSGAKESISIDVQIYATTSLPLQILSSGQPFSTNNLTSMCMKERQKECISKFVKVMQNPSFLSWRMLVFGSTIKSDGLLGIDEQNGKKKKARRKLTNSDFVRSRWDILKATHLHVKDVEYFIAAFYESSEDSYNGDMILDLIDVILSIYRAWQVQCLEVLKTSKKSLSVNDNEHVFGRKSDQKTKTSSSPSIACVISKNESVTSSTSSASSPFQSNEIRDKRTMSSKRYRKAKDLAYVRCLESSTDGLPTQFQPFPGEYTIDKSSNLVSLKKANAVSSKSGNRPLPRVRMIHKSTRMISKTPVMRLSDILAIDLRVLYLQVTIGKSMSLLSKSISKVSNNDTRLTKTGLSKKLPSPLLAATKVQYAAGAIEIYSRAMNVMSFLLSEDLGLVDEEDLIDLGYHDNGRGSLSSRIKKLRNDRSEAQVLIGKLRILCAESWYDVGRVLCDAVKGGKPTAIEMAKISILNLPLDSTIMSNEENSKDKIGVWSEPEKLENKVLHCYQFALSLLRQDSKCQNSEIGSLSSRSGHSYISCDDDSFVGKYKRTLIASIIHSIGFQYYAQVGNLETAKLCLNEALSRRRLLLREFQKDVNDCSISGSSVGYWSSGKNRNKLKQSVELNNAYSSSRKFHNDSGSQSELSRNDLLFTFGLSRKKQIETMEMDLSYTLEFAALTSHSLLDHQTSISLFQEAIILRALHAGKNSLDVARLHYNMGVIHDDLGQHQASLSRYGKSLKVRLSHLNRYKSGLSKSENLMNHSAFNGINDLEASVVLTLRCMGNVYRVLKDATNAIGCYIKAIDLLKEKLKRRATESSFGIYQESGSELGFGKGKGCKPIDLPVPGSNVDEIQQHDDFTPSIPVLGLVGSDPVADPQSQEIENAALSENDKIRKDIANMYSMLLTLVNDRKQHDDSTTAGSIRKGYLSAGYSSGGYGSASSTGRSCPRSIKSNSSKAPREKQLSENDDDDVILLHSAFNLGRITMHFGEYQKAMCYFEEAFRTLWTSIATGNSEGSESDISSKDSSLVTPQSMGKVRKTFIEGDVEEGVVYHAMAVAHEALSEHERAVRCFLTALQYYRQRFGMNSLKVAGALYDCGLSYWNLGDYSKAEDFWADCCRIVFLDGKKAFGNPNNLSHQPNEIGVMEDKNSITEKGIEEEVVVADADYARILHNLGNVHLQNGHLDVALQSYEEALAIREKHLNIGEGGYAELAQPSAFGGNLVAYRDKLRQIANTLHNLGWLYEMQTMYEKALSCLNQALFIKQSLSDQIETHCNKSNVVDSIGLVLSRDELSVGKSLSCAITLLRIGSIHVKIYNYDIGLSYYRAALCIQRKVLGPDHIAVARTLFDMGQIANHHTDASGLNKDAMKCFNEALRISKLQFGQHHCAVAGVMYDIGSIHDKSGNDLDAITYYKSSVTVYGRIYAKSLMRRFCFIPIFKSVGSTSTDKDGFNAAGLGNHILEITSRSSSQQAEDIADDKERELFLRASIALNLVAQRSGITNGFSLLSLELTIWKGIESIAANGMDSMSNSFQKLVQNFFCPTEHSTLSTQETKSDSIFLNLVRY